MDVTADGAELPPPPQADKVAVTAAVSSQLEGNFFKLRP
jgi:hypothetical protein